MPNTVAPSGRITRRLCPGFAQTPLCLAALIAASAFAQTAHLSSATTQNFGSVSVGSASTPATLTFTFDTAGTLGSTSVVTQGATGLDFTDAGTGSCKAGNSYAAGTSCTISVLFAPRSPGNRYGAALLTNVGGTVVGTGYLQGLGNSSQIAFLSAAPRNLNLTVNGTGTSEPFGVFADAAGDLFVCDTGNGRILKFPSGGGTPIVVPSVADGVALDGPMGIAMNGAGDLFIADYENNRVVKVPWGGGMPSTFNSILGGVKLNNPVGVAVDGADNLFIADQNNMRVIKVTASGRVTVIGPHVNGVTFTYVNGVAVDGTGNLFVSFNYSDGVIEIPADGSAAIQIQQTIDGITLVNTQGMAWNGAGDLFIADGHNQRIVEVPANGSAPFTVITFSASSFEGPISNFYFPIGLSFDSRGNLFVGNLGSDVVSIPFAEPPSLGLASAASGPDTVMIENAGNAPLSFPVPSTGSNPAISGSFALDTGVPSACPAADAGAPIAGTLDGGAFCQYAVSYTPSRNGFVNGALTLTDSNLNASGPLFATQAIPLMEAPAAFVNGLQFPEFAEYGKPFQFCAIVEDALGRTLPDIQVNFSGANLSFSQASALTADSGVACGSAQALLVGALSVNSTVPGLASSATNIVNIVKAPLTVVAKETAVTYGDTPGPLGYSLFGFLNGDTPSVVSGAPVLSTAVTSTTPRGIYPIDVQVGSLTALNYRFVTSGPPGGAGAVRVYKAPLKVTANTVTMTEGGAVPTLTYAITGFVNGENTSVVSGSATLTTSVTSSTKVGEYPITVNVSGLSAENYYFVPAVHGGVVKVSK